MRRLFTVFAAVMLATLLLPSSVFAVNGYHTDCDPGGTYDHIYQARKAGSSMPSPFSGTIGNIKGVRGTLRLGSSANAFPCENATLQNYGFTQMYPANLQRDDGGGLVQIGFGREALDGNGPWRIYYTPYDDSTASTPGGYVWDAWQPFVPQANTEYYFTINPTGTLTNNPRWALCISDITHGGAADCISIQRTWNTDYWHATRPVHTGSSWGQTVWWGYEVMDLQDVMGHRIGADTIDQMWDFQYRRSTDDGWYRWNGFSSLFEDSNTPGYFFSSVLTIDNYNDGFYVGTQLHGL